MHQVTTKHIEAHFCPNFFRAPHEKVPVIHPMFDPSKRMFHDLLSLFDFFGMLPYPLLHRLNDVLVSPA